MATEGKVTEEGQHMNLTCLAAQQKIPEGKSLSDTLSSQVSNITFTASFPVDSQRWRSHNSLQSGKS
jgi:hypothetical protein